MFLIISSTKVAQMVLVRRTKWPPEIKKKKKKKKKKNLYTIFSPETLIQIQNNFAELFLIMTTTKKAQMVPLPHTKWSPEPKIGISVKQHPPEPLVQIKNILQKCSSYNNAFYQNCTKRYAMLNKMAARVKIKISYKKHHFVDHLPKFRIISLKCSSY